MQKYISKLSKEYGSRTVGVRVCLFRALLLLAPFSLIPYISMPSFGFASFRIGLYQVLLAVFVAMSLPSIWAGRRKLEASSSVSFYSLVALGVLALASLVKAIDKPRSILLVASLGLLLGAVLSSWSLVLKYGKKVLPNTDLILKFGVGYGAVSLLQLGIATFSPANILLCQGCKSDVFGFARVNGFALEPQFWANALLPFFAYALVLFYTKRTRLSAVSLCVTLFGMMLTFSRGAFIAVAVALLVFVTMLIRQKAVRGSALIQSMLVVITAFAVGFVVLVGASSVKYSNSPNIAYNTARGMIEQLSLGRISLPKIIDTPEPLKQAEVPTSSVETTQKVETPTNQGVVEASQQDRVGPAKTALNVWRGSLRNMVLGVGYGNFAPFVQKNVDAGSPLTLTVYIFYILLLVESGLVGVTLFLLPYAVVLKRIVSDSTIEARVLLVVLSAFLVQYLFFGSYINSSYIWLWLGVGLGLRGAINKAK